MASLRFRIRVDELNHQHVRMTLFDRHGASCGEITVNCEDAPDFLANAWDGTIYYQNEGGPLAIFEGTDTEALRQRRLAASSTFDEWQAALRGEGG